MTTRRRDDSADITSTIKAGESGNETARDGATPSGRSTSLSLIEIAEKVE